MSWMWIFVGAGLGFVMAEGFRASARLFQFIPENTIGDPVYVCLNAVLFLMIYAVVFGLVSFIVLIVARWIRIGKVHSVFRVGLGIVIGWLFAILLPAIPVIGAPQRAFDRWLESREHSALLSFASRAANVTAAIDAYRNATGSYPDNFDVLVPDFLEELPRTGLHRPREFYYEPRGADARESYQLVVRLRGIWFDFNHVRYQPELGDPRNLRRNERRVGEWIYFDD